jgi:hypothetical protein
MTESADGPVDIAFVLPHECAQKGSLEAPTRARKLFYFALRAQRRETKALEQCHAAPGHYEKPKLLRQV